MYVKTRRIDSCFIVEIDNPPVNTLGQEVRQGLQDAIDELESQEGVERVILTGTGNIFSAGADIKEFDADPGEPYMHDIVTQIERSDIPWIAAINGSALGGGCEITLGCCYRIASRKCKIGLPEVTLGLIPGSGGTQRLPRLIGIAKAVEMITSGKPVSGEKALEIGLVHATSDNPFAASIELDAAVLAQAKKVTLHPMPKSLQPEPGAPTNQYKRSKNFAARKAGDLVLGSSVLSLQKGLELERKAFDELRTSAQSRALRHLFFAERKAKSAFNSKTTIAEINHVAVVGGGTMGSGIAYALLNSGISVSVIETDSTMVESARNNIEKIVQSSIKRQFITERDAQRYRSNLNISTDYGAVKDASLVIEAVFEDMDLKQSVFSELESHASSSTVLASNTSYLDLNEIAQELKDPSRVVGLHFFAPAHIMKLIEIVKGTHTSDEALATGFTLAKQLEKIPVLAGVCEGFIGNRILSRYRNAADNLLIEGALPWEIDEAMVAYGYAMGPYEAQDLSGLDIAYANRRRRDEDIPAKESYYTTIAEILVEEGRLGRKTGSGWYRYSTDGEMQIDKAVEKLVIERSEFLKVKRRPYSQEGIVNRLFITMINEAADILGEGIAQSASDIDLVTVYGYGYPRWRGGLMYDADAEGVVHILNWLNLFQMEDPLKWAPSRTLLKCNEEGISLSEFQR